MEVNKELLANKSVLDSPIGVTGLITPDAEPLHGLEDVKKAGVVWKYTIEEYLLSKVAGFWFVMSILY